MSTLTIEDFKKAIAALPPKPKFDVVICSTLDHDDIAKVLPGGVRIHRSPFLKRGEAILLNSSALKFY